MARTQSTLIVLAAGHATVTLRTTSGGIVHDRELAIRVADELPTCVGDQMGENPARPDHVWASSTAEFADGERSWSDQGDHDPARRPAADRRDG